MTRTADTITDEEIRELRDALAAEYAGTAFPSAGIQSCWDALNGHLAESLRRAARQRCAEIWNQRAKEKP